NRLTWPSPCNRRKPNNPCQQQSKTEQGDVLWRHVTLTIMATCRFADRGHWLTATSSGAAARLVSLSYYLRAASLTPDLPSGAGRAILATETMRSISKVSKTDNSSGLRLSTHVLLGALAL